MKINCNKSLSSKLQKLQNRPARILTSSSNDANADDLFVRLGWQKLNPQRELKTATMVYKSLNGLAPDYQKSMFTDRNAISTYSLRNCEGKIRPQFPFSDLRFNGAFTSLVPEVVVGNDVWSSDVNDVSEASVDKGLPFVGV